MALPNNVAPDFRVIPAEGLSVLRALTEANLPHLATIVAETTSGARTGGALPVVTTTLQTAAPCRLLALKRLMVQMEMGGQAFQQDQWALVFRVGVVLPEGAVATVSGTNALGVAWTRVIRIGLPVHSRAYEIESRYTARDTFNK